MDATTVMVLLDALGYPKNQNWEEEKTTWALPDGRKIIVCGPDVEILKADSATEEA